MQFSDRVEAGRRLAAQLTTYADRRDVLVLALPRGGVPVAYEVAKALRLPMDVYVVRKLGAPGQEELAIGAIATGGVRVLNDDVIEALKVTEEEIESTAANEQLELERRERLYRSGRPAQDVHQRTVIVIDDGIATGSTMRAAVAALRKQGARRIVIAAAVAPPSVCEELRREADEVICTLEPDPFFAISLWYENFPQVTDEEVRRLLEAAERGYCMTASADATHGTSTTPS